MKKRPLIDKITHVLGLFHRGNKRAGDRRGDKETAGLFRGTGAGSRAIEERLHYW